VSAEFMLIHALRRAKELSAAGETLFGSPALQLFLTHKITKKDFQENPKYLNAFADLDDYDIWGALKVWQFHADLVLSTLCKGLIHRDLFKIEISKSPFPSDRIQLEKELVRTHFKIQDEKMLPYFVYHDLLTNKAYSNDKQNINLLMKNGSIIDLAKASDNLNISALAQPVEKYFLCYPRH
ncbi:MAG: phosphohydrolase, partial [Flavobacteriales bacterium]